GSERILQRLMQEAAAGIKNADVFNSSDIGHYVLLKKKGMLAKYMSAGGERLRGARLPDSDFLQLQASPQRRCPQDMERSSRPEMERKARNCPPRLQRKYRDLRAGSGESLRLGLLQAVSSEQAPSDPIGPRPGAGSRSGAANS